MPAKSYSKRKFSSTGFGARDTRTHHLGAISFTFLPCNVEKLYISSRVGVRIRANA